MKEQILLFVASIVGIMAPTGYMGWWLGRRKERRLWQEYTGAEGPRQ